VEGEEKSIDRDHSASDGLLLVVEEIGESDDHCGGPCFSARDYPSLIDAPTAWTGSYRKFLGANSVDEEQSTCLFRRHSVRQPLILSQSDWSNIAQTAGEP